MICRSVLAAFFSDMSTDTNTFAVKHNSFLERAVSNVELLVSLKETIMLINHSRRSFTHDTFHTLRLLCELLWPEWEIQIWTKHTKCLTHFSTSCCSWEVSQSTLKCSSFECTKNTRWWGTWWSGGVVDFAISLKIRNPLGSSEHLRFANRLEWIRDLKGNFWLLPHFQFSDFRPLLLLFFKLIS